MQCKRVSVKRKEREILNEKVKNERRRGGRVGGWVCGLRERGKMVKGQKGHLKSQEVIPLSTPRSASPAVMSWVIMGSGSPTSRARLAEAET